MSFQIVHNNIVNMETDAIVNAANSGLKAGGGVCGAIFAAAGAGRLQKACDEQAPCPVGEARITPGYHLKAKYVIHTVGPIWRGGESGEEKDLKNAYRSSLELARENECESIAFPLLSAGIFGYPKEKALKIAVETCREFLEEQEMEIFLVVFDRNVVQISEELYRNVQHYINEYAPIENRRSRMFHQMPKSSASYVFEKMEAPVPAKKRSLDSVLSHLQESFQEMLFRLITEKGYTDVEVYKKANMDRKLFSKIKCNPTYCPKKQTVLSLAIALELSLDETLDLLNRAGYSLSLSSKADVIVRYFLENEEYDIFLINETLFAFDQQTL